MKYVGKTIIEEEYNTTTMTARNSTATDYYEIIEDLGDTLKANRTYTNRGMYGEEVFEFKKEGLEYSNNSGRRFITD